MIVHRLSGRLAHPPASLPMAAVDVDWNGAVVAPPVTFAIAIDDERLWFVASRAATASVVAGAVPGAYTPGLWRGDVAELFLGHLDESRYLEVNLAPNGAWWTCEFQAPRERRHAVDSAVPDVRTHARSMSALGWHASVGIPLDALRARLRFDDRTTANVTFVVDTPDARHVSAGEPAPGPPDFHDPALRERVILVAAS